MAGEGDFWERNAGIYDTGIDYVLGNNLRPIVLAMLGKEQPLGKTVEIGCGTGYYTPLLAQLSDHVVATDLSEAMLSQARERVKGLPKVSVQREDAEKTSFPDMSFDSAFLGLIFQLVDGPKALAEMHRILKPKGVLILAIPTMDGLRFVDKIRGVLRNYKVYGTIRPPGTRLYTRRSLAPLITGAGFNLQQIEQIVDPDHPGGFSGLYIRAVKS